MLAWQHEVLSRVRGKPSDETREGQRTKEDGSSKESRVLDWAGLG